MGCFYAPYTLFRFFSVTSNNTVAFNHVMARLNEVHKSLFGKSMKGIEREKLEVLWCTIKINLSVSFPFKNKIVVSKKTNNCLC